MAVKFVRTETDENRSFSQIVNDFFLARKKVFLVTFAALLVVLVAVFVVVGVGQSRRNAAYETIYVTMEEWFSLDSSSAGASEREEELIAELRKIASGNKRNFAGARANLSLGEIYLSKKDWAAARDFYAAAAEASPKFYTTGLSLYNAGICSDELNMPDEAIGFFTRAIATDSFEQKPRAQYNIARIQEQNARTEEALASYRLMQELYPDSPWTDLAHSRIIALELAGN